MKLSEAILLGSVGTEQGRGGSSMYKEGEAKCALGAALKAIGKEFSWLDGFDPPYTAIREVWPLTETEVHHPAAPYSLTLKGTIIDLNDNYGWTRPQIAEWVKQFEPQDEPQARTSETVTEPAAVHEAANASN